MMKLKINGPIISNDDQWIYDLFEYEATSPNKIIDNLPDDNSDVGISINSYGGLVDAGNEIYTALMHYPGKVTIDVIMAGSAASIIAMAGKPTRISPVGQMMIHNVSMGADGDYHAMDKASEILSKANESLSKAYQIKTGLSKEELLDKMDKETWLTADDAKEFGFVDEILFEETEKPVLVADGGSDMLPEKLTNELKKMKLRSTSNEFDLSKLQNMIDNSIEKAFEKQNKKVNEPIKDEELSPFDGFFFYK